MNILEFKKTKSLEIKNKGQSAEIYLYGAIGQSFWDDAISAKQFSEELNKLDKNVKEIVVRINSAGGDVFDGISIYNLIQSKKKTAKVICMVDGLAASIASIIMLAGDEVIMNEGSLMMIHKPWSFAAGNSNDLEKMINRLDDVEEQLLSIYAKKTKKTRAELRLMLSADNGEGTWMDANMAKEQGFVDKISEDSALIAASAKNVSWVKNMPKNIKTDNDIVKEKVQNLKNDIEKYLNKKK